MRHKDKKDKPAAGQLELFCDRTIRRIWIQNIQIPSFHYTNTRGRRVYVHRTATLKDCLKVIESYCGKTPDEGWYLFIEEIAAGMSKDRRTASRAVADCKGGGMLLVRTSCFRHVRSHFKIVWTKIEEIIARNPDTAKFALDNDGQPGAGKSKVATDNGSQTTHDNSPATHDKIALTHDKIALTHDKLSWVASGDTSSSRARSFHHDSLPNKQPSWAHGKPNGYAGWPFRIELPHLKFPGSVQRLWKCAIERRDVIVAPESDGEDRVRFFALARFVARLTDLGEIANPGAYFHAQVVRRDASGKAMLPNWCGEGNDRQWAEKAIAIVDCSERETPADRAAREGRR